MTTTERFWGINVSRKAACVDTTEEAAAVAERVKQYGFDRVRFHVIEGPLSDGSGNIVRSDPLMRSFDEMGKRGIKVHLSMTYLTSEEKGLPLSDPEESERRRANCLFLADAFKNHEALVAVELANEEMGIPEMDAWYAALEADMDLPAEVGVVWTQLSAGSPIEDVHYYGIHPKNYLDGQTWADERYVPNAAGRPPILQGRLPLTTILPEVHTRPGGIIGEWNSHLGTETAFDVAVDLIEAMTACDSAGAYLWVLGQNSVSEALGHGSVPSEPFTVGHRPQFLAAMKALGDAWRHGLTVKTDGPDMIVNGDRFRWTALTGAETVTNPNGTRVWSPGVPPEVPTHPLRSRALFEYLIRRFF